MIRSLAIVLLAILTVIASVPLVPGHYSPSLATSVQSTAPDPSGSTGAFNYTYSQANLYTEFSSPAPKWNLTVAPGTSFVWKPTVVQTSTNTTIPGSGFEFNLTGGAAPGREIVSWNLTVPKPDCQGCTTVGVNFDLSGSLTKGSNASYTVALYSPNSTAPIPSGSSSFTTAGTFPSTGSNGCPEVFCVPVSNYIGYHLNLSFVFGWNSTAGSGMYASVGEISVASIGSFINAATHTIQQDSNPRLVDHTATLTPITYNNTLLVHLHPSPPLPNNATLRWQILAISIYYESGYTIQTISMNNTGEIFPTYSGHPNEVALERQTCVPGTSCSQALIDLNMTDYGPVQPLKVHNSTITITATTPNSVQSLSTVAGGVATQFFTSGGSIGIKVVNKPSVVNASTTLQTGTVTISFSPILGIAPGSFSTATGSTYDFTLPSSCGSNNELCKGPLNVTALFSSGFDLGNATASFKIGLLQVSLTGTGGSNSLTVSGTLTDGNGKPVPNVNATLFAIDRGTPTNIPYNFTALSHPSNRLYISNVTLVNGVFTQDQSLMMLFTIVNPNATQMFNATLTIAHDWPGPQAHNMSTTFPLKPGDLLSDLPLGSTQPQTYEALITFTGSGVQVKLENLRTAPNSWTQTMTNGTSPVLPNAPHAGLFNLTLTTMINNQTQSSPISIFSPAYAYVGPGFAPARYLYSSPVFTTQSNGAFTVTINKASGLLGAKNLTVFVLARNANGVVVANILPSSIYSQSTFLIANSDSLGDVGEGSTATATLHLTSNSTLTNGITELLTVNLVLQSPGQMPVTVATTTGVAIGPGQSQTVKLSFKAPSNIGSYTLSFTSPEYGGVLTSQTLQVTVLNGYIQYLIPAAIGVVAAIIVLGVYLIRERGSEEEMKEERPKGPIPKPKPEAEKTRPAKSLTRTPDLNL